MIFNRIAKTLLVATLLLTGCGTSPLVPTASQKTAARPIAQTTGGSYALMPVAQSAPTQAALSYSSIRLLAMTELTDDEIAEEADDTYAVQANDKPKGFTGLLRRTESTFALEHTKGLFKKQKVLYTVQALNNDVAAALQGQENRKVLVKAIAQGNDTLVVHSVKRVADLGFLLTATTEDDGEFALKNVTPGAYSLSFVKTGYLSASSTVQANKRKTANVAATLAPTN